ncbi:MAG: aminomethyl-transferring glycine dehydrogenase [Phycisphaerales bacterium]|nr:aminomethyl-transferring glycine dehydrogenase [Phycisphaerales bacterium]NNM27716.1 aminomethyl-transferring glycine dehydrogenase [Phycisphaerales bacterium]
MNDDAILAPSDTFLRRHLGPDAAEIAAMLQTLELSSLDALTDAAVPPAIRTDRPLDLPDPRSEFQALADLRQLASRNRVMRSMIGQGYHDTITPPVIQRNVLENPGWYTQYTPYQAEIAQGRLEALLNFQTMVSELTALPLANASLLDEATSAAEAMLMCHAIAGAKTGGGFYVSECCHPQTIAVVQSRAQSLGLAVTIGDERSHDFDAAPMFGVLLQYPDTDGVVGDDRDTIARVHAAGGLVVMAADLLALTMITPPGELGADIAVGSTQRFGVPMGFGGPHAGYLATQPTHVRRMPGRLIGVSRDATGRAALRMAIQTREQHIKRDRATSNICTAQVLLAIMAAMYAVYHGPDGLRRIAQRVHAFTRGLARGLESAGHRRIGDGPFFDTLRVEPVGRTAAEVIARAADLGVNLRGYDDGRSVGIACDETTTAADVTAVLRAFGVETDVASVAANAASAPATLPETLVRDDAYMTQEVFHAHHSETAMLRYLTRLQSRDLSLAQSMIPLGSCTMKLNATSEMLPVTWPEFGRMHPFAPVDQTAGYQTLFADLERWLGELTGFAAVSLQPNAGSQGEYAGLAVIRAYHKHRGDAARDVCLIPVSAHGTNPASAVAAGFRVVPIACDDKGNIDLDDLRAKASQHAASLGALMVTYPSTHGVFEPTIRDVCAIVHENGGQVYLDGANMNAMVGVCRPGEFGADVCHLNLHKTFCIPHGGGGPGMGPIGVASHLRPFLPGHPVTPPASAGPDAIGAIAAAPYGSPSILPITWMYLAMTGAEGQRQATQVAILNANYMARRLDGHYDILFTGPNGRSAHEFIVDCRPFDRSAGIKIDDIAKRLMDYGFHAPTMAWPVPGTLMIEPTESESKAELDRFCDALIAIRGEIAAIERGDADRDDNVLKNAPHTVEMIGADEWSHAYARSEAAFPAPWLREHKFWPPVARIDNPYGDRNLVCTCPAVAEWARD